MQFFMKLISCDTSTYTLDHTDLNDAVTYHRIKLTDAKRTEKMRKTFIRLRKCGEGRRGSRKERIHTRQVTDRERLTNVRVMVV